ncbi:DUF805 domain-containing protein [Caulobacter sp. LARHSG274]
MGGLKLLLSPAGRIGRRAFAWSALGLYGLLPAVAVTNVLLGATGGGLVSLALSCALLGLVVLAPYVGLCLHLKRLRDAGRGPGSLMSLTLLTLVGTPLALALPSLRLAYGHDAGPEGGDAMMFAAMALGAWALLAWPFYSLWVGLARPKTEEASVTKG